MRRPSSVRTGMFCRFGSVDDSRPVAATVCMNVVWMRPSSAIGPLQTLDGDQQLGDVAVPQQVREERDARSARTAQVNASASVVNPVLVRFVFGMPSSSKSTTCSCLGDPRFTSWPISA